MNVEFRTHLSNTPQQYYVVILRADNGEVLRTATSKSLSYANKRAAQFKARIEAIQRGAAAFAN